MKANTALVLMLLGASLYATASGRRRYRNAVRVATLVAHALKRELRTADYVARVGGDEFVVLLPEVKPEALEAVTDKLLRSLREIRVTPLCQRHVRQFPLLDY